MRLLIALALWVAASIPLALVAGRLLRGSSRSFGLIEEIEAYLHRQSPAGRGWRHSGALVFAAGLVAAVVLLGNEAVQQLPPAQVVADRRARPTTATTASAPSSPTTAVSRHHPSRRPARPAPAGTTAGVAVEPKVGAMPAPPAERPDGEGPEADEQRGDGRWWSPPTTERTTTAPGDEREGRRGRGSDDGDDHRGTRTTSPSSTTTTTNPPPVSTPPTTAASTPAGSTTTSTTSTTAPDGEG